MYTEHGSYSQSEAGSYFPELPDYDSGVSGPIPFGAQSSRRHPVIASLTQRRPRDGSLCRGLEQQAAALELNMYYIPADATVSGQTSSALRRVVRAVKRTVKVRLR